MATWKSDGVGLGGQYLMTKNSNLYAGVHAYESFALCAIWTPGCGFSPKQSNHETVVEAKQYAEKQIALLTA